MKKSQRATGQTLQEYLDSLLRPAVAAPQPEQVADVRPFAEPVKPAVVLPRLAPIEAAAPEAAPAAPMVSPAIVAPVAVSVAEPPRPIATPVAVELTTQLPSAKPEIGAGAAVWRDGRPQWGQSRFECLLFAVGGLNLAVPLAELGTIYTLEPGDVAPIPAQADWFMGLLSHKQQSIRVVDSALIVMPERYQPEMRAGYRYVITLNGSDWGLAVDQVANALPLDPDQVRWRGARSRRMWLAGTVVDHMCALLDPAQLVAMFQQQDRRRAGGV